MRDIIKPQLEFGQVDISKIEIDFNCRDDVPKILLGLQYIYVDEKLRKKNFKILKTIIKKNARNGHPGMDLWCIFVLGMLRLNLNIDYDKTKRSSR